MTIRSWLFLFMAKITALQAQKRNKDRVNVYLDGTFAFGLEAIAAVGLAVDQELSDADIAALQDQDTAERAKKVALGLISRRPRSVAEIRRHLYKKQYDDLVINQVIDRLEAVNLLDDTAFAAYWVEQREAFKPRSRMALRQELQQKGVERAVIDVALEEVDESSAAVRAAEQRARRWRQLPEDEFRAKLGGYLQRLGFPYDIISETIHTSWRALHGEGTLQSRWPDSEGE